MCALCQIEVYFGCLLKCETLHSESENMGYEVVTESSVLAFVWKDKKSMKIHDGLGTS